MNEMPIFKSIELGRRIVYFRRLADLLSAFPMAMIPIGLPSNLQLSRIRVDSFSPTNLISEVHVNDGSVQYDRIVKIVIQFSYSGDRGVLVLAMTWSPEGLSNNYSLNVSNLESVQNPVEQTIADMNIVHIEGRINGWIWIMSDYLTHHVLQSILLDNTRE